MRDRLEPAGALAVYRAERDGVGDARANLRHAARERAAALLKDVPHADLEIKAGGRIGQKMAKGLRSGVGLVISVLYLFHRGVLVSGGAMWEFWGGSAMGV